MLNGDLRSGRSSPTGGRRGSPYLSGFEGAGGVVAGQPACGGVGVMRGLVEPGDHEAGGELPADLLGHCVAVLQRRVGSPQPLALLGRDVRQVAVRQTVADDELAAGVHRLVVEQVHVRVEEAAQQRAARPQYAEALAPHGWELRHEQVRNRVEDEVERGVAELRQVAHVAQYGAQLQTLALRDHLILGELTRRVVEDRDPRAGRGERRALLSTAGGQAENVYIGQVGGEPRPVDRPVPDEYDGPVTGPCPRDGLGSDRARPLVAALDLKVPRHAVVRYRINAHGHTVAPWRRSPSERIPQVRCWGGSASAGRRGTAMRKRSRRPGPASPFGVQFFVDPLR